MDIEKVSKEIKKLLNENRLEEAIELCKEFSNNALIQSQHIKILLKEDRLEEAEKICKEFPTFKPIQSQYITILIKENRLEEAEEICKRYPDNAKIQFQYYIIQILYNKNSTHNEEIDINDLDNVKNLEQYLEKLGIKECKDHIFKSVKENEIGNKYLNYIKSRLRLNLLDVKDIENIKKSNDLSLYEKELVLIACYYLKKNNKSLELEFKNAKRMFSDKEKELNKLYNKIKCSKIFDIGLFDELLSWNDSMYKEVEKELKEKDTNNSNITIERKKEEDKTIIKETKEPKKKRNLQTFYISSNTTKNKEKKEKKIAEKESIIDDKFHDLIFELRKEAYIKANTLNEINFALKAVYINHLDYFEDLSYKKLDDLKSLLKILEYCKKYNVKPSEELITLINNLEGNNKSLKIKLTKN